MKKPTVLAASARHGGFCLCTVVITDKKKGSGESGANEKSSVKHLYSVTHYSYSVWISEWDTASE